jgi:hypothetical protein
MAPRITATRASNAQVGVALHLRAPDSSGSQATDWGFLAPQLNISTCVGRL